MSELVADTKLLRVVFVDDDPQLLDGLRRMLRRKRATWQMEFSTNQREVLERVASRNTDVVVSDMRMPEMNGAALLRKVWSCSPETIRIVLSGQADAASWLQVLGPGQRYLAKPCSAERLEAVIGETVELERRSRDWIEAGTPCGLESPPPLHMALLEALEREAPVTELQRMAASAVSREERPDRLFRGAAERELEAAMARMGRDVGEGLLLAAHTLEHVHCAIGAEPDEALASACVRVANRACAIAQAENADSVLLKQTASVGLLYGLASLLAGCLRRETNDRDAAHLAGFLLRQWGSPDAIAEAVAFHVAPREGVASEPGPLLYLHVSWALERAIEDGGDVALDLDADYLERLGLIARVERWRSLGEAMQM